MIITTTPATDGRDGIVKNYVAGGKVRMRRFIPSVHLRPAVDPNEHDLPSGPAVREECYDNEPEPCATEEEMEAYDIVLAEVGYELEMYESEYNAAYAEYSNFCSSNPEHEGCQEPSAHEVVSGPSACEFREGCWIQALYAAEWLGIGLMNYGFKVLARAGAAALGVRLAAATVAASTLALIGSAFMVGWYIGSFIDCKIAHMYAPVPDSNASYWYEPVYYR